MECEYYVFMDRILMMILMVYWYDIFWDLVEVVGGY